MSTSVTGRLVNDSQAPLVHLHVVVRDESLLFSKDLNGGDSGTDGRFAITIPEDAFRDSGLTRHLTIRVTTQAGRLLKSLEHDDQSTAAVDVGDITIRQADVTGWTVTLLGSAAALPVRDGNAMQSLVDDEDAWQHVKDAIAAATTSIDVMQLGIDMPANFYPTAPEEDPEIVLTFGSPVDPVTPRTVGDASDFRPERMLLDAASQGKTVRIMIGYHAIEWGVLAVDVVILLVPLLLAAVFDIDKCWSILYSMVGGPKGSASDVKKYFSDAGSDVDVLAFKTGMFSVVHSKMVLVDGTKAIVLGSPFSQSYWDTHAHHVFEPRRGSAAGEPIPVHDVSMAVRGPAVKDMQESYRNHWNRDVVAADQVDAIDMAPAVTSPEPGESLASLQLVRTINRGVFSDMADGEQGILEAYLRAIENAQNYIYFENQYFTDDAIASALVAALNDTARPHLQVILMVNVTPDMPFYPVWQGNLFQRIRRDAGANASRFGVFTAWTHDPPMPSRQRNKPMIMPNYLHSKTGIVDGTWATVGSANLDGASLDYFQIIHALQFGDNRNDELNYLIFNGIDGHPSTDAVDQLRIALWSEHLGIDPADPRLAANQANDAAWLTLWNSVAEAKRAGLAADPTAVDPTKGRVLAYPADAQSGWGLMLGWAHPHRDFLQKSGIDLSKVDLIEHTTPFGFHSGTWR